MMFVLPIALLLSLAQTTAAPAPASPASPSAMMTPDDPKSRMALAEKVNGLHGMDIPWHLKATYEVLAGDGTPSDSGTYEEWRVSDKQYRLALHSPSVSVEEYGTDHGVFRTGDLDWPAEPLSSITSLIEWPVSPQISEKNYFENYQRSFGAEKLPCTAIKTREYNSTQSDSPGFCFARTQAVVFYANTAHAVTQTAFEHIKLLHGLYLAWDMQEFLGGRPWLKLHVDSLEGLTPAGFSALTVPPAASPATRLVRSGDHDANRLLTLEYGKLLKKTVPSYPSTAKQMGVEGTVFLDVLIRKDGTIGWLRVLGGPPALQQPALDAVKQWVYQPPMLDGKPVELEARINVVFNLGGR